MAGDEKDAASKPNIIFILADDLTYRDIGCYGSKNVKTPNIDAIADEGVLFTNSFSACPSCTASRSAVISRQDIWRVKEAGILFGSIPKDLIDGITPRILMLF
ncbi:MAG: sulfatase-like hydrolase/transferase [Cyclobacteriaceae bacterium]|nr:sulfatase-like hydrolase/transferase [Cyclobacteriaceae bacterium]